MQIEKRLHVFTLKLTELERQRLERAAGGRGKLSEYARRRLFAADTAANDDAPTSSPAQRAALQVFHVDELGADPFRVNNGALAR